MIAYLQHGELGGPYLTERVPVRETVLSWQAAGLTWTASGYGARIATRNMVQVDRRWRRVYCCCYSNSGTLFIGRSLSTGIIVDIYRD